MDRFYLLVMCAGIVLLTTAIGLASADAAGTHGHEQVPLLLRVAPR
jgi:hypothetical protein